MYFALIFDSRKRPLFRPWMEEIINYIFFVGGGGLSMYPNSCWVEYNISCQLTLGLNV